MNSIASSNEEYSPHTSVSYADLFSDSDPNSKKFVFTRWQSYSGTCFHISIVGITYAFGVFSKLIKSKLGFSESDISLIASVGNTGLYLSVFPAMLMDKYGTKYIIRCGDCLICIGVIISRQSISTDILIAYN